MSAEKRYEVKIDGDVRGQMAVGEHIKQSMRVGADDRDEVRELIAALKREVATEAPADQQEQAGKMLDSLESAIVGEVPNVGRMAFIRDWFSAHAPRLTAAVSRLILSPLVGKIVDAAGDLAATEFRNTFGS